MALTMGRGPFGPEPAGRFNFTREGPAHVLYSEVSPKRVRVTFGGETVADSRAAMLLFETGLPPVWYFPPGDVRSDLLEPTDHHSHCPFKGDASYWTIRAGGREAENAVWAYPHPIESAPRIEGRYAFYANRVDAWYEEDDEVRGHPRDPYHRVDVRQGSATVTVRVAGTVVASSSRPKLLFETALPVRYYLPEADVRLDLLRPSDTTTVCPYKGLASYWSAEVDGDRHDDVAWTYGEPLPDGAPVAGWFSFAGEGVEVDVT